ncbi:MAG: hypothetical protein JWR21_2150 [Herminiimonas sp.]|nr:hypothetical protein [Herminiimonas sp.]
MHFLYVKIPVDHVSDQTHQFEDKLDQILNDTGLGSVAGWGDSLGVAQPDGSRRVAYTRIDVDVSDLASARALLRTNLPSFGVPTGTEIHYTIDNRHFKDIYRKPDWLLDQPLLY